MCDEFEIDGYDDNRWTSDEDFEDGDLPQMCGLCGCYIYSRDGATTHSECEDDFNYIKLKALERMTAEEWLVMSADPDKMIMFLESLLVESRGN